MLNYKVSHLSSIQLLLEMVRYLEDVVDEVRTEAVSVMISLEG